MKGGHWLIAAAALLGIAGSAEARRKPAPPPPPLPTDTLIENVNGYTLDKAGALLRFNALLIDERGRVKQLLKPGDKREPVKFKTDARGQTLLPGLIDAHGHVMALGRQTPAERTDAQRPRENPVDQEAALTRALQRLASSGITMVADAGTGLDDWLLYRRFGDEGRLSVRIYAMADGMAVLEQVAPLRPTPWLYDDRLVMRAVVLSAGTPQAVPSIPDARIRNLISKASMIGAQTAVGASGAAADVQLLDAYAEMLPTYGRNRRYRIEYGQMTAPADTKRLTTLDLIASVQPRDAPSGVMANGVRLAFGSNSEGDPPKPFQGLYTAVTRNPGLSVQQAFAAYTTGAAYAGFAEDRTGTLEPGKWADFILIDRDIFAIPPAELPQTQVIETWLAGKRVFVRGASVSTRHSREGGNP